MNLAPLLERLSMARVLVIGDLMLDHYIWGDVSRISPEAPVPVVHATRDTWTAGGAANVALNLASLGVRTSVLGYIGEDEAGYRLRGILEERGVHDLPPPIKSDAPTIIKTRVLARTQQLCRIDREAGRDSYRLEDDAGSQQHLAAVWPAVDAVLISDYAKGVITQGLVDQILQKAQITPGLLVAVDPKPSRRLSFRGAGLLTPNRHEALELAGLAEPHPHERYPLEEVCRRIHEEYAPQMLVITLGADGLAVCREGKVVQHLPTVAREVFDVSGAGDTVVATLTAALAVGADILDAARLANTAAGCVVAHMGTAPVRKEELAAALA